MSQRRQRAGFFQRLFGRRARSWLPRSSRRVRPRAVRPACAAASRPAAPAARCRILEVRVDAPPSARRPIRRSSMLRAAFLPKPMALETLEAPRDQVAARVELAAAGFQRVAVHLERAVFLDAQTRRRGRNPCPPPRPPPGSRCRIRSGGSLRWATGRRRPRRIELAQPGLHHFDGLDVAVLVAHDAVRRGQEDELARLPASAASVSSRMAGMSLRSRR